VPTIWYMHDHGGGFYALFWTLTACAALVLITASILPRRRPAVETVPAE